MKKLTALAAILALVASSSLVSAAETRTKEDCETAAKTATKKDDCQPLVLETTVTAVGGGAGAGLGALGAGGVLAGIGALALVGLALGGSGGHSGSH